MHPLENKNPLGEVIIEQYNNIKNIIETYEKINELLDEYAMGAVPLSVEDGQLIQIYPTDIQWWLLIMIIAARNKTSTCKPLDTSITLSELFDILSVLNETNEEHLTLCVLKALKIGVVLSDDITIHGDPLKEKASLSIDGSEEIRLPNPRKKPYVYITQEAAEKYLNHHHWIAMRLGKYHSGDNEFACLGDMKRTIRKEFNFKRGYHGDAHRITPIERHAVVEAVIGIGESAGHVKRSSNYVEIADESIVISNEFWSTNTSDDDTFTEAEIIEKVSNLYNRANPRELYEYFVYTNILYHPDDEDGLCFNHPTNDSGPEFRFVDHEVYKNISTYEEPQLAAASFDPDGYAVDQFVESHVEIRTDDDSQRHVVPVEQFMTAFDEYAKLNGIELEELDFDVYRDMRAGALRHILEDNFSIERSSVRVDGEPTRVFRPVELGQTIIKLLDDVGMSDGDSE